MLSLNEIGLKCGTDKSSKGHAYLDFYERFFRDLRQQPIKLLEIGVFHGKSVAMWQEYFPAATIIGVDINPAARQHEAERIRIEIADQSSVADLVKLGVECGPFDIIVDDGSHYWNHQITSLKYLYPFVKPKGYYIIEDINTSFGSYVESHRRDATVSAYQYVQKLTEYVTAGQQLDCALEEDPFLRTFAGRTEFIAFHCATVLLRSRAVFDKRDLNFPPLLVAPMPGDIMDPAGSLTVHLGLHGDVTNRRMLVGGVSGSRLYTIQGFVVQTTDPRLSALQYRVLLADGKWTEWVSPPSFAGTRGAGATIRGFAARLNGRFAEEFECLFAGAFLGEDAIVQATDGAACVGTTGGNLEAMQIWLRPRAAQSQDRPAGYV